MSAEGGESEFAHSDSRESHHDCFHLKYTRVQPISSRDNATSSSYRSARAWHFAQWTRMESASSASLTGGVLRRLLSTCCWRWRTSRLLPWEHSLWLLWEGGGLREGPARSRMGYIDPPRCHLSRDQAHEYRSRSVS